jgi:hypothetical protein
MITRYAAAALLLLAACASTPTQPLAPAPPVKVVVTAAPSVGKLIDVARITAETELALRRLAPSATPATISVRFAGTKLSSSAGFGTGADVHGNPEPVTYRYAVASVSPTPWLDGYQPVIATVTVSAVTPVVTTQVVIYGRYTIIDANRRMLEDEPVLITAGRYQRELAVELARRVAKLAHGS